MDRLNELQTYITIVESGSLVAAARRLRRSPSAITRALSAIEARVSVRLIERSTRHFAVTEAGYQFAEQARVILASYELAVTGAAQQPINGLLRITAPVQFGRRHVAPVVAGFLQTYPDIRIEFLLQDRNMDLIEERIDVALRIGELADTALIKLHVGDVRRVHVASPEYLKEYGHPRTTKELAKHDLILGWQTSTHMHLNHPLMKSRLFVDDVETQISFAKLGRGIAQVLSYQVFEELKSGALVRLLQDLEPPPLPVQILSKSAHLAPSKVRAFKDALYAALKAKTELRSRPDTSGRVVGI